MLHVRIMHASLQISYLSDRLCKTHDVCACTYRVGELQGVAHCQVLPVSMHHGTPPLCCSAMLCKTALCPLTFTVSLVSN
jgi:hypothetical protein